MPAPMWPSLIRVVQLLITPGRSSPATRLGVGAPVTCPQTAMSQIVDRRPLEVVLNTEIGGCHVTGPPSAETRRHSWLRRISAFHIRKIHAQNATILMTGLFASSDQPMITENQRTEEEIDIGACSDLLAHHPWW